MDWCQFKVQVYFSTLSSKSFSTKNREVVPKLTLSYRLMSDRLNFWDWWFLVLPRIAFAIVSEALLDNIICEVHA